MLVLAGLVAAAALAAGYVAVAKGFVLGSLFSVANFLIMTTQTPNRLGKTKKSATVHSGLGLGLRMLLLAIPLFIAIRRPEIDVISTVIGVFNLQISVMIYGLIVERFGSMSRSTTQGR